MSRRQNWYPNDQPKYPDERQRYPNLTGDAGVCSEPKPSVALPSFEPEFAAVLDRLAPSRITVLLVGKSQRSSRAVAWALHQRSPRAAHPFAAFDCKGRDSENTELALFGGPEYAAVELGAIRAAGAGTLYVSAIDELPLLVQPRFLRFLDQEREVRVVTSTDEDLLTRVEQGQFRLDLAERLSLVELMLPSALAQLEK